MISNDVEGAVQILKKIAFLMLIVSCSKSSMNFDELVKYIDDPSNDLVKEINNGEIKVKMTYKPNDFLIRKELIKFKSPGVEQIDSIRKKYINYYYFTCALTSNESDIINEAAGNRDLYNSLVQKLSFSFNESIKIISEKDTLNIDDYIFPRLYEFSKATEIMFAIKKNKISENDFKLLLMIPEINLVNEIFEFNINAIESVPNMKFN